MLIVARVVQGLGASMITPQTMAIITRIFPAVRRGKAMALWGATAGVATLVGPILGGVLVDALGWEWIFFINVPVGDLRPRSWHRGWCRRWRPTPTRSTGSGSRSAAPACSCWSSASRRATSTHWSHRHLGDDRRRPRAPRPVRPVAGAQQAGAAGPARPVPRPQLLPGQRRHLGDGLRDHRAGHPAPAVGPGGPRVEPDQVGAAAGPDGDHDDPAGPPGRQAHRPRPPAADHRVRLRCHDRLVCCGCPT